MKFLSKIYLTYSHRHGQSLLHIESYHCKYGNYKKKIFLYHLVLSVANVYYSYYMRTFYIFRYRRICDDFFLNYLSVKGDNIL